MRLFFTLVVLSSFCLSRAAEPMAPLRLEKTIPLENVRGRIDHLAVDVAGQRLFVAALGNDSVEVIDLKAGKRAQSLPGFAEPQGIAYVAEFDRLFVANASDGTCRILDGRSFKTIRSVQLGGDADNVRYDEKAKRIYVGYGDGAIAAIDPKSGEKLANIKLPAHPESFRLETNGARIFVNLPGAEQIAVIDREKNTVVATWPLREAKSNFPMILDEPNHRLFVGCRHPTSLLTLDAATGKTLNHVEISGDTDDLFYDARRKRIYISCGAGFIDIVSPEEMNAQPSIEYIATVSGARTSLYSPELDKLYLAVRAGLISGQAEIRVYQPR